MSAVDSLIEALDEQAVTGEQVAVSTDADADAVVVEAADRRAELDPEAARQFADELEATAEDEGWYHTGQTEPLLDEIRESADSVA